MQSQSTHMLTSLISKLWRAGLCIFSKWKPAGIPDNQFKCYDWSQERCFGGLLVYCDGCWREITPQISECTVHWLRCCVVTGELMRWRSALNLKKQNSSWSFQEVKSHATALDQSTCTRFELQLCSVFVEISTQIYFTSSHLQLSVGKLLHWRDESWDTCHNNWIFGKLISRIMSTRPSLS